MNLLSWIRLKKSEPGMTAEETRKLAERGMSRQRELARERNRKLLNSVQDAIASAADEGKSFCNLSLHSYTIEQAEEVAKKLRALGFAVEVSPDDQRPERPHLLIDWGCE